MCQGLAVDLWGRRRAAAAHQPAGRASTQNTAELGCDWARAPGAHLDGGDGLGRVGERQRLVVGAAAVERGREAAAQSRGRRWGALQLRRAPGAQGMQHALARLPTWQPLGAHLPPSLTSMRMLPSVYGAQGVMSQLICRTLQGRCKGARAQGSADFRRRLGGSGQQRRRAGGSTGRGDSAPRCWGWRPGLAQSGYGRGAPRRTGQPWCSCLRRVQTRQVGREGGSLRVVAAAHSPGRWRGSVSCTQRERCRPPVRPAGACEESARSPHWSATSATWAERLPGLAQDSSSHCRVTQRPQAKPSLNRLGPTPT